MKRTIVPIMICACILVFGATGFSSEMGLLPDGAVRDCAGRVIPVDKPFSRIISLYGAHTENLITMGAGGQLVGVPRADKALAKDGDKRVFSVHDGPERFLSARPDLVIVRPMLDQGYASLMERLEQFGIRVVSLQPGSIGEMRTYWRILGRLSGKEPAAETMIRQFDKGVDQARELTSDIESGRGVYFEAIHDRFRTFSPGSMPLFALECAGGVNVAEDAEPVRGTNIAAYSKERIMSRADEIDVYLSQVGVMNRIDPAGIAGEPGYDVIKAVKNGDIYMIDEHIVSRPTPRLLEGICRIGEILYPDLFDEDAKKRILQEGNQ